MGKKSGPKAPDYKGAAEAEANASMWNTQYQTAANRPNMTTPWGSQTWTYTPASGGGSSFDQAGYDAAMSKWNNSGINMGNPETGVDYVTGRSGSAPTKEQFTTPGTGAGGGTWASSISLDPRLQAALDSQFGIQKNLSSVAEGISGQVADSMGSSLDLDALPAGGDSIPAFSFGGGGADSWRQKAQDAVWDLQKPMLDERRSGLETQLANMGLARGSAAWEREMRSLRDAEDRSRLAAISEGRNEATAGLDMAVKGGTFNNMNREARLQETLLKRRLPLDDINALLAGNRVQMPQMPGFSNAGLAQAPDYTGAANSQYSSAIDQYNAKQGGINNAVGALTSLASAFMFSDERLKEDVVEVGLLSSGVRVVHYRYRGLPGRFCGVIAQELRQVRPDAVCEDASGYLKVDYSKVRA